MTMKKKESISLALASCMAAVTFGAVILTVPPITDKVTVAENANLALGFIESLPLRLPASAAVHSGISERKLDIAKNTFGEKLSVIKEAVENKTGIEVSTESIDRKLTPYRKLTIFDPFANDGDIVKITSGGVETNVTLSRKPQTVTIKQGELWITALTDDVSVAIMILHEHKPEMRKTVITPVISKGVTLRAIAS